MKHLIILLFTPLFFTAQDDEITLVSKMDGSFFTENGTNTPFWGFGEYFPGVVNQRVYLPAPLLVFNYGDSVHVNLINQSPETHTIHLHGLDVSQINDGVPATSFGVLFNDSASYKFRANNIGTFLYHCHVNTNLHAAMGMSGMLVVRNYPDTNLLYNGGPSFNKEYYYLSSDMYLYWNYNTTSPGPFHMYEADYFMVNGKSGTQLFDDTTETIYMNAGDTALIHIGNVGYNAVSYIFPVAANATAHLSDGRILPSPISADTLTIYPGERYSVLLTPTQFIEGYVTVNSTNLYNDTTIVGTNYIGINVTMYPSGVEDNKLEELHLYPNPANNIVNIRSTKDSDINIYSIEGKFVKTTRINKGANSIDISDFTEGMYLVISDGFLPAKFIVFK